MNMKNEAIKILEWIEVDSVENFISQKNYHKGVYILWFYSEIGQETLYVGQGIFHDRMRERMRNEEIMDYAPSIYYATIRNGDHRDGIEKYLSIKYHPILGKKWPRAEPIPVNSPFEENFFDGTAKDELYH